MNVIVSNRQKDIIDNANIDAIKDLNGLFNVNDLITKFKNYFFSKMILDATSVVDFATREVLTTLANEIGAERLIILLPSNPEPPMEFKKLLIELKIYNFTNNIEDVIKFIEKPNTYEDAIKLIDESYSSDVYVDNSIKEQDDIPSESIDNNENNVMKTSESFGDILSRFNLSNSADVAGMNNAFVEQNAVNYNDSPVKNDDDYNMQSDTVSMLNETPNIMDSVVNNSQNSTGNKNTFLISDDFDNTYNDTMDSRKIIIGVKGITSHAGCTSLIYMLHRMVAVNLKKSVLSIEIGKNDFRLFRDNKMISTNEKNLKNIIDSSHEEVIFVDLNNYDGDDICSDILYLVEPSTIKLNGLMAVNKNVFNELKNKKVLLNKSLLSPSDINTLEGEAGLRFFYNIEPLNDRIFNDAISKLLDLLGIR